MTIPAAEDFTSIATALKKLEEEKAKARSAPLPDVQPDYTGDTYGYAGFLSPDYDPA